MAKITIPYSAATGTDKTPTDEVNESFFSASSTVLNQNSGAVVNGNLQQDNLEMTATYEHFKQGAYSTGASIGATDNLDYFPDIFSSGRFITQHPAAIPSTPTSHLAFPNRTSGFQPLPGLNQTFYNPYKYALAIFTWNMTLAIDGWTKKGAVDVGAGIESEDNNYGAWVVFKMANPDGTEVTRGVNGVETAFRTVLPKADNPTSGGRRGAQNDLYYSGHLMLELNTVGWYTAGLHLGFSGTTKTSAGNILTLFGFPDSEMYPGLSTVQSPLDYEALEESIGEDLTIWDQGVRQARVRVRSLRHVLFKL